VSIHPFQTDPLAPHLVTLTNHSNITRLSGAPRRLAFSMDGLSSAGEQTQVDAVWSCAGGEGVKADLKFGATYNMSTC
jgi:hypothetical protein